MAEAARLEGKQPPALYSLARDGALHSYVFLPDPEAPGAAASAAAPAADAEDEVAEDGAAGGVVTAARPAFTGRHERDPDAWDGSTLIATPA